MYEALVSVAYFDNQNKRIVIKLNLEPFYDEVGPDLLIEISNIETVLDRAVVLAAVALTIVAAQEN